MLGPGGELAEGTNEPTTELLFLVHTHLELSMQSSTSVQLNLTGPQLVRMPLI